jgi:glycosyltransferase involved in cell wall biosynthesis
MARPSANTAAAGHNAAGVETAGHDDAAAPSPITVPITPPMWVVWHARPDVQRAFDLATPRGRRDFSDWYALRMAAAPAGPRHDPSRPASSAPLAAGLAATTRRLAATRRGLARAVARMPATVRGPAQSARHAALAARATWELRVARVLGRMAPAASAAGAAAAPTPSAPGARIVGSIRGESGMGHSLRSFAAACETAGVPVALVESGVRHPSRTLPRPVPAAARDPAALRGNVLYMPAAQLGHAILALGERTFLGRPNILVPFWELSRCPEAWRHAARFVDEVWAPTRFIQESFSALTPHVVHMPPSVPEPVTAAADRSRFGLPEGDFVFFFSFDFHSYPERKNPLAAVAAFREAFPAEAAGVALVLHAMNADVRAPAWRRLREAAGADPRIRLSTARLAHDEVLALCAACDCYVSLHRAEGFGYGPAEAMLLGKPAIVTDYSGPCDYARPAAACLVDYALVDVRADQYPHHAGCTWAEPDVGHAAWHMRRLAASPSLAAEIGGRGREAVRARHAADVVGGLYRRRFRELGVVDEA